MNHTIDTDRKFNTFTPPPVKKIRDCYTYRTTKQDNGKGYWAYNNVVIERHNDDGTVTDVYEYTRKYSAMYSTFEPFRQLKDGVWKDYALISSDYTRFEVVDLDAGKVVAQEPYPTITQAHHERWAKAGHTDWMEKDPIGTEKPGSGFCPVEFWVPDFWDKFDEEAVGYSYELEGTQRYLYPEKDFLQLTGEYAIYSGCIWGDDSGGWKIRYIDLSRISEGVVTSDERFGYIRHASEKPLRESIEIWEDGRAVIPVELYVDLTTGKAYKIDANWGEEE